MVSEYSRGSRSSRDSNAEDFSHVSPHVKILADKTREAFIFYRRVGKPKYEMPMKEYEDRGMWIEVAEQVHQLNVSPDDFIHHAFNTLKSKSKANTPPKPKQLLTFRPLRSEIVAGSNVAVEVQRLEDVKAAIVSIDRRRKVFPNMPLLNILTDDTMHFPIELVYCVAKFMGMSILASRLQTDAERQLGMLPNVRDFLNQHFKGVLDAAKTD